MPMPFERFRVEVFGDFPTKSTGFHGRISDREIRDTLNSRDLIVSIRDELCARLADHLMLRLRPAIDKALAETFGDPEKTNAADQDLEGH